MNYPEGIFLDKENQPSIPSTLATGIPGLAAGMGAYFIDGWIRIVLIVLAVLLVPTGVSIFLGSRHPEWYWRTMLTGRGLVEWRNGQTKEIVPADAVEAVGLYTKSEITQLVLWFDATQAPPLSRLWRISEMMPGMLRLKLCDLESDRDYMGDLGLLGIREIRKFVEANGLGEWRHERADLR